MFNFHKPRTYRSTEGCCICRAKSSSSRFTDSRKYERDTMQCFDLKQPRQGEICNACVLLVKRYKRLPVGSRRNWSHVVDARTGGPGVCKIQPKYKSERISSRAAQQQQQANITDNNNCASGSNSPPLNNGNINSAGAAGGAMNGGTTFIPEKFSKIFKKSKKIKDTSLTSNSSSSSSKRKSANNGGCSQYNTQSPLPITTDALDSDYEDTRLNGNITGGNQGGVVVQFQTQTRASAYKAQAAAEARKRYIKLGTKRRKCLTPRKYRRSMQYEESVKFVDDEQWQEQKSCCGMFYECAALGNAILIDIDKYKPCDLHKQRTTSSHPEAAAPTNAIESKASVAAPHLHKTIIQSMPAVVQLQPPQGPPPSISLTTNYHNFKSSSQTPVLKKHHLFFKRQSECFPHGDMVAATTTNTDTHSHNPHVVNITKTESDFNMPHQHQHSHPHSYQQQHQHQQRYPQQSTTTLQRHIENAINSSCSSSVANPTTTTTISPSSALSISVTSSIPFSSTMPQMPKHSLAKVTTISPPTSASHYGTTTTSSLSKSNSFQHKTKDTGKVVKHSMEKFNTAVRLKTNDLHEMKPIIKTVDKSYILAKPPTQANINTLNATTTSSATYQSLASYNAAVGQPLTTTSLSAASPTSSTSSTSSTKFSDNSSDSGFDENMLDRKSVSPLHDDCDKKLLSRPGVQTMFLASGVQIQGQPQNLMLTGNEVAAKILQNRKYSSITAGPATSNSRSLTSNHPSASAVKIAQISTSSLTATAVGGGLPTTMSSAAQAKIRAIYNNNNTIQHENGITTIVPASSLAATSQISAMQNIAPSTVTITPAPPVGTQFNPQNHNHNVISRKLTTANIINLQSNTQLSKSTLSGNHHINNSSSSSSSTLSATNQKIILLKTSSPSSAATSAPGLVTKYNSLQTTTIGATSLHGGSGSGGGGITR